MLTGFVLINVAVGKEKEVHERLMGSDKVQGVRVVFGEFDVIARVEVDDLHELMDTVMKEVRGIDGVQKTTTLISTDEDSG